SSSDDPSRYRDEGEVELQRELDPLLRLDRYLRRETLETVEDASLDAEWERMLEASLSRVEALPPPALQTLFDDVFAALPWHLREQRALLENCLERSAGS
ncbi:MAG TPA: hypothetical protein VFQ61_20750, partial [Polyangiaceae bacterium]|nr:hypothetical protein [Polyangiaceae bacterium]